MTMARHQFTVQDAAGNVVPGAHVEVRREISGQPLAALYSDRAGTVGIGNPFDADSSGFAFFHVAGGSYQIRVYTGTSGAPTTEKIWRYVGIGLNTEADNAGTPTQREITGSGTVVLAADELDEVYINGPTAVTLPDPALRGGRKLRVVDGSGNAGSNGIGITVSVPSGKKLFGVLNGTYLIDGNGGSLQVTPRADGSGWN